MKTAGKFNSHLIISNEAPVSLVRHYFAFQQKKDQVGSAPFGVITECKKGLNSYKPDSKKQSLSCYNLLNRIFQCSTVHECI